MKLHFFGSSHGAPEPGRFCSGTLLETGGASYLIDCGAPVDALMLNCGLRFEDVRGIFLTHMHEDHVGCLTGMIKEFGAYHPTSCCTVFFAEETAIAPFTAWLSAIHEDPDTDRVRFAASRPGIFYEDGNVRVTGIPTDHIHGFPTFSYGIECLKEGKKILFTGDMRGDLSDFPRPAFTEHWDAMVSELTHYRLKEQMERFSSVQCDRLFFNHKIGYNIDAYESLQSHFPYPTTVISDGEEYTV